MHFCAALSKKGHAYPATAKAIKDKTEIVKKTPVARGAGGASAHFTIGKSWKDVGKKKGKEEEITDLWEE